MPEVSETARARVQALVEHWDWPDPAILEAIFGLGEEAVPALDELLTPERLAASHEDEEADSVVYYAMELLAALGVPAALPVFLRAYRQAGEDTAEAMEDAFLRLGPGAMDGLLAVVTDETLTYYPRTLASSGALNLAAEDPALRARAADALRSVLTTHLERDAPPEGEDEEDETLLLSFLAGDLSELADPDSRPLLKAVFDSGRIDPNIITYDSVEKDYEEGRKRPALTPRPFLEQYREDWRGHQEEQESKARLAALEQRAARQPVVLDPRVGRNGPCWCGSGKKYKKCHLAQDEKEKVRL